MPEFHGFGLTGREAKVESVMEEDEAGQWVHFEDVRPALEALENQIPEVRISRLEKALNLVASGCCAECGRMVRGWESPTGILAPEMWASLREAGIDPCSGHKEGCTRKGGKR